MPDYGDERGFGGRAVGPPGRGFTEPATRRPFRSNMRDVAGPVQKRPAPVDIPMQGGDVFDKSRLGLGPGNWQKQEFDPKNVFDTRRLGLGGGPLTYGDVFDKSRLGLEEEYDDYFDPFDPDNLGMDSGEYLAGMYGGGLDDAAGMNDSARGMLEGAGFDVAGGPGMEDKRMFRKLWGITVNKPELINAPQPVLMEEWEKLKQLYLGKKYGGPGYTPGDLS